MPSANSSKPRIVDCREGRCAIVAPSDDEAAISVFETEAALHPKDSALITDRAETMLVVPKRRHDNSDVVGHVFKTIDIVRKARGGNPTAAS